MQKALLLIVLIVSTLSSKSQLHVAGIFSDSMVLQRGRAIPVWGWATSGEKVTVHFHQQHKTAITDAKGKWQVSLDAEQAGGPYTLSVEGNTKQQFVNVLVGDVWICSGQSNMEWNVANSNNGKQEVASADYPMIRHIKINNLVSDKPLDDIKANSGWHAASPAHAGNFTAVGYFFARELYRKLKIPIGLINTTWGGTNVETWISREALQSNPEFKDLMLSLPSLNLDSLQMIKKKALVSGVEKLQGSLPAPGVSLSWKNAGYDDSKWPLMKVPGLWEEKSLPDLDGQVWFRKNFILTKEQAAKGADLLLGMIDDNDSAWINGKLVGETNGYNKNRIYIVAPGILKEGSNSLVVKIDDTGGGGGFYSKPADLSLKLPGGDEIPLAGDWYFQVATISYHNSTGPNSFPSLLFNAMLNPLIPYGMKGALWYQGESNAGRAYQYRQAFPLLINDWRSRWNQGDFPFYFVQLSSFNSANGNSNQGSTWAELREAQTFTLALPNTGMAVTTDIGNATDIHPRNKQDVGKRLAAIAFNQLYQGKNVYSGPQYLSMKTEGNQAILSFTHTGSGLQFGAAGGATAGGFEIAGQDGKFFPANAVIKGNTVVVSAPEVKSPASVHYAWADDAGNANLFNKEGFPACPFRTDQWKGITEKNKYTVANQ